MRPAPPQSSALFPAHPVSHPGPPTLKGGPGGSLVITLSPTSLALPGKAEPHPIIIIMRNRAVLEKKKPYSIPFRIPLQQQGSHSEDMPKGKLPQLQRRKIFHEEEGGKWANHYGGKAKASSQKEQSTHNAAYLKQPDDFHPVGGVAGAGNLGRTPLK